MRKFYSFCVLFAMTATMMFAQGTDKPEKISGFYRLINPSYEDAFTVNGKYDIKAGVPDLGKVGQVFEIETDEMYSAITEIQELQRQYDEGLITGDEHVALLQQVMTLNAWKSGFYPIKKLRSQGVDYIELINKLPDYADDAIEAYLNDEVPALYENYGTRLILLAVFASDIINPTNLESVEAFSAWVESYLTKWRSVTDFNLYLQCVMTVPEGDTDVPEPTGAYYFEFKTPVWVGNMEKAQTYINSIILQDGEEETLDIWGSAKKRMLAQIAAEYGENSEAVTFVENLLGGSMMNTVYVVGETEKGDMYNQPLPDVYNTNGVELTAEDVMRCQWYFLPVDEENPVTVTAKDSDVDAEGNYYTTFNTDFAYNIINDNVETYFVTNVDEKTLKADMVEVTDIVPAGYPVVVKSQKPQTAVVPVATADAVTTQDNILLGTLFVQRNDGDMLTVMVNGNKEVGFWGYNDPVPANSAYILGDSEIAGINAITNKNNSNTIYDLMGRKVENMEKGVYIVNGKKVIRP